MNQRVLASAVALGALLSQACGDSTPTTQTPIETGPRAHTNIQHVVIIWQENHTFDNYFGRYCTAPAGSNPTCTDGPACCEAVPATEPSGASPMVLDDTFNGRRDPDHSRDCEIGEVNGGMMNRFVTGTPCSNPGNFAVAAPETVAAYHTFAREGALADRYFQPEVGQTSANDMYFAIARHAFDDNSLAPMAAHASCTDIAPQQQLMGRTIADVVLDAGYTFSLYIEGYAPALAAARATNPTCMKAPDDCPAHTSIYPCVYDPSDIPFAYYQRFVDNPTFMRDYGQLARDLQGTLPNVVFIKPLGYHTEHPGAGTTITDGAAFVSRTIQAIRASRYASNTLILLTWDEGGGYFDHIAPPADSTVDMQPYGTRIPMIAIGPFARRGAVSHVTMEHSSIVKFLEFNFTGTTGQLGARDAVVNNLGSLLDPAATGVTVPTN